MAGEHKAAALQSLQRLVTAQQVITHPTNMLTYRRDAGLDEGTPDGVVLPTSTEEVMKIIQWANEHRIPIVARGAGTGLSGGAVAELGGIVLEISRMEGVVSFDAEGGSITVQPGITNTNLDAYVRAVNWYYPPDPSSGMAATIGGNIGENSGGPHCFKYGVTTNYVNGLEVVTADGKRRRFGGEARDYPEYDLPALLTGSEGTLGIVTAADLRLIRNPPAVKTLLASFESIEASGEAVSAIIARGLLPATMELMDQRFMHVIEDFAHAGLPVEAGAALIVEVDGYPASVDPQMDEIVSILEANGAQETRVARNADERKRIWLGRKSAAGAIAPLAPAFYLVDVTVPRSHLGTALGRVNQICANYDLRAVYVCHAGDGNLHPLVLIPNPKDPELMHRVHTAGREIAGLCATYDGSITGEHGVGIEKRAFMPLMYSADELHAMCAIKQVFDPHNLLNPQKIFPTEMPPASPLPAPIDPPASPYSPANAEEAAAALRAWLGAGQQVRVVGGGTKSGSLPPTDALLKTDKLRGISTYARDDMYVTVGAGTPLGALQAELAADNMWVPLFSPWEDATVGGVVAANFNAPLRMRYASVRDQVLAVVIALPNGRVIRAGRPVVKNVAGYDMPRLFVGSYGTLGLLTEVTLKLTPMPRVQRSLLVGVQTLYGALSLAGKARRESLVGSATLVCRGADVAAHAPQVADAPYVVVLTLEGLAEDVDTEHEALTPLLTAESELHTIVGLNASQIWADALRNGSAQPDAMLIRAGVAPGDLNRLLKDLDPSLRQLPFVVDVTSGVVYLHAPSASLASVAALRKAALALNGYACAPCAAGTSALDPWGYTPDGLDLMQAIKTYWDPNGLLNPGAFLV